MKIDVNTIKAFCEGGLEAGLNGVLDTVYPESIRQKMQYWQQGYEAAMNAVLELIAKDEDANN